MSMLQGLSSNGQTEFGYILRGIRKGLSGTQILGILQDSNRGYRVSTFFEDFRSITKSYQKWDRMKFVRRDFVISEKHYSYVQVRMDNRYQTTIRVRGYNMHTGEQVERNVTIGHDTVQVRQVLEDLAAELVQDTSPDLIIESLMPEMGRENPY